MVDLKSTIEEKVAATPTGVSFVHIKGYENSKGEKANILLNVGVSYENAQKKDVETLKELDTSKVNIPDNAGFEKSELETARNELLGRLLAPSKQTQNRSKGQADAYEHIGPGIKVHKESGTVFLFGKIVKKEVIEKGDYGEDRRKSLTKAKDHIRKHFLEATKFRQYKIDGDPSVEVSGDTMDNLVIRK